MSHSISKNNPNRWFLVQDSGTGESSIIVFGNAGEQGVSQLVTGQPNLITYLTEDELEIYVDNIAGPNYYYLSVLSFSEKFQLPSGKYSPLDEE
jgi:hypothetical protein